METINVNTLTQSIKESNFKEIEIEQIKNLEDGIEITFLYKGIQNTLFVQDINGQPFMLDAGMDNMSMTDRFVDFVENLLD